MPKRKSKDKTSTMSKFIKIALSRMQELVIKLLDPAELFDKENILEDFNLILVSPIYFALASSMELLSNARFRT